MQNRESRLARNKRIPTHEDLHPNTRFIDNRLIDQLRNNEHLLRFVDQHKLNWSQLSGIDQGDLYKG